MSIPPTRSPLPSPSAQNLRSDGGRPAARLPDAADVALEQPSARLPADRGDGLCEVPVLQRRVQPEALSRQYARVRLSLRPASSQREIDALLGRGALVVLDVDGPCEFDELGVELALAFLVADAVLRKTPASCYMRTASATGGARAFRWRNSSSWRARSTSRTTERAAIKKRVNVKLGSRIVEEKSVQQYRSALEHIGAAVRALRPARLLDRQVDARMRVPQVHRGIGQASGRSAAVTS